VYQGHPDRLEEAHDEIKAWAAREGIRLKRERLNKWRTEVLYLVE
jgi:hypothetical protein